MRVLLSEA